MKCMQYSVQLFFAFLFIFLFSVNNLLFSHGFGPHTLVHISDGSHEEIGQLSHRVLDKKIVVQSYEVDIRLLSNATIIRCGKSIVDWYIRFSFSEFLDDVHDKIICTPLQNFYSVRSQDWVSADALHIGDKLLCKSGAKSVKRVEYVHETLEVYALHVEKSHTFFVGHHGVLTHNMALPALLSLGVSIPFGGVAAGTVGSFFGPATLVAGAVIGSFVGACIAMIQRDSIPSYKVPINNVRYVDAFVKQGMENNYAHAENDNYDVPQDQSSTNVGGGGSLNPTPKKPKEDDDKQRTIGDAIEGAKKLSDYLEEEARKRGWENPDMPSKDNKQQLNHIFPKDKSGHDSYSDAAYQELQELVRDPKNYLGKDEKGCQWFGKILENGKQKWAKVYGKNVKSGGTNSKPVHYNPDLGLLKEGSPTYREYLRRQRELERIKDIVL